ncbi:MAG: hypothetical protein LKF53_02660 [Solobacterium sp.]|jgi:hypothetical protein|nr:hypothetical protein [Solobacterium sp.]MCH4205280.1 hypothetical protein [Solobacterium sp.]MCH4226873.1 hypothetical protein [Solobacterium sp.]MCH4281633.1 hypothetical protein [Solobacterium sp.]
MKILDEKGEELKKDPDFSTGRYVQNGNGDLVFTLWTPDEEKKIKDEENQTLTARVTQVESAAMELAQMIGGSEK